ncbi:MAG: MarR family transcriptional regulator [Clostridiales bacterium]|nr:MarR family transcriptional regulator [Clostridiales bacterium]
MDTFEKGLNELLIQTFRDILKVEELILQRSAPKLSITEVHLIEAVRKGKDRALTVSEIAGELQITVPSATVAVNKMVNKGYVTKEKSSEDGRAVIIRLTREGEKIYRLHRYIHLKLVRAAARELTEEEKDTLLIGVRHLDEFFKQKMAKYGGINEFSNNRNR